MPASRCTCPSFTGMDYFALRALGEGCTANLGYICPRLTARRASVRQPTKEERVADDLANAKEQAHLTRLAKLERQ